MLFWRNRHLVDEATLNAFVDGELDAVEAAHVTLHVDACAACSETIAELRALSGAMKSLAVERAPRSFALREADVTPAPKQQGGLLAGAMPLMGSVAMVAFLTFFVLVGVDVTGESSGGDVGVAGGTGPLSSELERAAADADDTSDTALDGNEPALAEPGDAEPPQIGSADATDGTGATDGEFALPAVGEEFSGGDQDPDGNIDDVGGTDGPIPDEATSNLNPQLREDDDDSSRLRRAQAAAAAVALVASGSVVAMWWRRRSAERI